MITRILVPYDGSSSSDKAVKAAVEYAKSLEEPEVMLFHVVAKVHLPPSFSYGMHLPNVKSTREYLKELYERMKNHAMALLNRKKQEIIEKGVGNVRTQVSVGHPAEQILARAKAERADLIIIGSVGHSGIAKLKTLGSISRSISERASCPVMIVH